MANDEQDETESQRVRIEVAVADLLPLVLEILGLSGKLRGPGSVPLPDEARSFFIAAACMGIVRYFEEEVVEAETQLAPAREMAPVIAAHLRQFSMRLPPPPPRN